MKQIKSFVFYSPCTGSNGVLTNLVTVTPDEEHIYASEILLAYEVVVSYFFKNPESRNKVPLIKMVRAYTKLGLKEAKYLVDDAENTAKIDAEHLVRRW